MFCVVALASRLTCQAGASVLSHLRSAALKAITWRLCLVQKGRVTGVFKVIPAFQHTEKGYFECTKCTPKLLLNAAIEIEGFRVKS